MKTGHSKGRARFCTQCGNELEEFCFSPGAENLDSLRTAALRCQLEGHQTGKVCAKVFIAGNNPSASLFAKPRKKVTKKALQTLRDSILQGIRETPD
jgi:hypothetical protein